MKPILFSLELGGRQLGVHSYGLLIAFGFAAGIALAWRQAQRIGFDGGKVLDLSFWFLVSGLLGSRALYVALNAGDFARACSRPAAGQTRTVAGAVWDCTRALHVWEGGLVFYGGVLGAALTAALFARANKWSFKSIGDLFAPSLALGHVFGRLGCFAAGCCFGKEVAGGRWGVSFPPDSVAFDELRSVGALAPNATAMAPLHATQLYEAAGELCIFGILLWLRRRRPPAGTVVLTYAGLYAALRFVVEMFRGDLSRGYVVEVVTPGLAALLRLPAREPVLLSSGQLISLVVIAALVLGRRWLIRPDRAIS